MYDHTINRPLTFAPAVVGVITGRDSAAERNVLVTARRRWPAVRFAVHNCAVQGPTAAAGVIDGLRRLDADPTVEVIVIARGGGSVEDLLPFYVEGLVRAIAATRTPVVTAVGHETDTTLGGGAGPGDVAGSREGRGCRTRAGAEKGPPAAAEAADRLDPGDPPAKAGGPAFPGPEGE